MQQHNMNESASPYIEKQQEKIPDNWVGCEQCDTITLKESLEKGESAYCPCCGALLYQKPKSLSYILALTLTALIVFMIANSFSIVMVELQGSSVKTTLLGAVIAMFKIDKAFVGVLILITTFIVPLLNICLLLYVLNIVSIFKRRPKFLAYAMRLLYVLKTWAMIEVFLIGVLVALVKLVGMVVVVPGIGLWSFAVLSVLMVMISSIQLQNIWDEIDRSLLE